jgi:hypothetical protein
VKIDIKKCVFVIFIIVDIVDRDDVFWDKLFQCCVDPDGLFIKSISDDPCGGIRG